MNHRRILIVVVVIGLVAAGIVGVVGPAAAQAQSGNGTGNATGNGTDDTAFDDPSSVGNNTSFDDPSSVGNNTSIDNSSSSLNTNVSYKAPESVTGNASGNNSSLGMGAPPSSNNPSDSTKSCGGNLNLGTFMSDGFNMTCYLKKWLIDVLFGGFMEFMQGIWGAVIDGIFTTPVPMVDGDPAIFAEPTNSPWNTLWNAAMFTMVPIGLIIWGAIFLCSSAITSIFPLGPHGEYKKRQMNNKAVLAFIGILGSWGLGSSFLWLTNGVTRAIMPAGSQIASDGAMLMGNVQGAAILAIAAYLSGGTLIAYFALIIIIRILIAFIFMVALPVLIPLIMVDVGPLEYVSNSIEQFVDVSIMFIILTIPMGLVLRGGYLVVNALNEGSDAQSAATSFLLSWSGGNGALIFGVWILAGLVPLFMYRRLGHVKGIASSMMNAGRRASDRLRELSESDPSEVDNGPDYGPGSMRPDDILEGTDVQRSSDTGEFGGALGDGRVHAGDGDGPVGMLGRGPGMLADPRDPNASPTPNRLDEGHPAASALPGVEGPQQTSGTGGGRLSQFSDRVGNVGDWAGNARSNLNDRINNAREMGGRVRDNGGNIAAGAAGATAGFFGAGASEENSGDAGQNTTRSDVGSHTTSGSGTNSGSVNQNMDGGAEEQSSNIGGSYYREEKGEQIYVPQSAGGLPSEMQVGVIQDGGFKTIRGGMPMSSKSLVDGSASNMKESYAEENETFVARDQESGQLYDLSEVDTDQQPSERDRGAEERHKGSARDVQNARGNND